MYTTTEMVTFQAGLYSSLLAAALARNSKNEKEAYRQARFLQMLLRKITFDLNLVRQIARFMENLAVRAVFESMHLDQKQKQLFYRTLLYSDEQEKRAKFGENGGRKTQQWFLKAVFGTSKKHSQPIKMNSQIFFPSDTQDTFQDFDSDGMVSDPGSVLLAIPEDPHLEHLLKLFESNKVLGNIILVARREFCRGYQGHWEEYPQLPTSYCMTGLIEELACTMDQETVSNLVNNFLRHQAMFIKKQLEDLQQQHLNVDLSDKLLPELLCYIIDFLPLDGRTDLEHTKDLIHYEQSQLLQEFVENQRRKLGEMMDAPVVKCDKLDELDDTRGVDIGFAIGFGDKQCVQADFLIPALLRMAKDADIPITIIPEGRPVNMPVRFGSRQTHQLLGNLSYFAEKYSLDREVAQSIETQFNDHIAKLNKNSSAYDLACISFLADVSRQEMCFFFFTHYYRV